jgi:glycosyltransferase involved in cell wall biosynthesis
MIHLFINALAASAGGGLTYIRNVIPHLAVREDVRATILVGDTLRSEIVESARLTVVRKSYPTNATKRFWREQRELPGCIHRSRAEVLLSTGNFALFRSPVPQILLSRNALYTSSDFIRDLRERGDYKLWIDTAVKAAIAKQSVRAAECTVAPSAAFAADLRRWTGKEIASIHHGFDHESFFRDQTPLAREVQERLDSSKNSLRLLFVSHYNYYRNFETLIRAVAILNKLVYPRAVRLVLTCKLDSGHNPGSYDAETAAALVRNLGVSDEVVELGAIPYRSLHHVYRQCDFYVTPAYAETFAHPLVEAMASGVPVIASDLPVHREICGDAALYFSRFSPGELAERLLHAAESKQQSAQMRARGLARSKEFSWRKHVDELLALAQRLAAREPSQIPAH